MTDVHLDLYTHLQALASSLSMRPSLLPPPPPPLLLLLLLPPPLPLPLTQPSLLDLSTQTLKARIRSRALAEDSRPSLGGVWVNIYRRTSVLWYTVFLIRS